MHCDELIYYIPLVGLCDDSVNNSTLNFTRRSYRLSAQAFLILYKGIRIVIVKMPAPSQLAIQTSVLQRLVKEEASYHKELEHQEVRIAKLEQGGDDENAEYTLRQEASLQFARWCNIHTCYLFRHVSNSHARCRLHT
jgi:hypothetical protein